MLIKNQRSLYSFIHPGQAGLPRLLWILTSKALILGNPEAKNFSLASGLLQLL
jgi:hypothetical protein